MFFTPFNHFDCILLYIVNVCASMWFTVKYHAMSLQLMALKIWFSLVLNVNIECVLCDFKYLSFRR